MPRVGKKPKPGDRAGLEKELLKAKAELAKLQQQCDGLTMDESDNSDKQKSGKSINTPVTLNEFISHMAHFFYVSYI